MSKDELYLDRVDIEFEEGEKDKTKIAERLIEEEMMNEYLRAYAELRSLFEQDVEAWRVAKAKGLDARNSFRVLRLGKEGDSPHYHIFTSGEEGQKEARKELETMNRTRFVVDNKTVRRYGVEDVKKDERVIGKLIGMLKMLRGR